MASVGFAKLLRIRVQICIVLKAASPPKIKVLKFYRSNLVSSILFKLFIKKVINWVINLK
jgi:hypothetical protein